MKYPVLRTRFLPNLYKHCKKVQVLHVSYEDRGFLSQDEQRGIWLQDTREKLYEQIEGNFTTCQATRISGAVPLPASHCCIVSGWL